MTRQEFIDLLKSNGYRVFSNASDPNCSYLTFWKDNRAGYAQHDRGFWEFFSIHKGNQHSGTGYRVTESQPINPVTALEFANKACATHCPHWDSRNASSVQKFQSPEQWLKTPQGSNYVEI